MVAHNSVKSDWQKHWKNKSTLEESGSFLGNLLRQKRLNILKNTLKKLCSSYSILDMGCGGGTTLSVLINSGFVNVTGIDFTPESIEHCEKLGFTRGKNLFISDAKHTFFSDNSFDVVFSEGLWEHFIDPRPYMVEAARLSRKYIIVIQPNHFSFFGKLMQLGWTLIGSKHGGVKEYSFPLSYFTYFLKMYGFELVKSKSTILHEQAVMVFKKQSKWHVSQQHEAKYVRIIESKIWKIPYSLDYWKAFLNLADITGQGVEVGCGYHGIYNFASNIVGVDSINFHKSNFVQATGEHLPFSRVDFAILCNSLDHCEYPEQVLNEVYRTTSKLVLWTYTYPKIISFLLSKLDKMHPHHFTENKLSDLIRNYSQTYETSFSPLGFWRYTNSKTMKLKLLVMHLLNIKGCCVHLRRN